MHERPQVDSELTVEDTQGVSLTQDSFKVIE